MGFDSWKGGLWGRRTGFLLRGWVRKDQIKMQLLGPRLGGSCTPPTNGSNDAFSTCFDDGFGWDSPFEIWARRGEYMRKLLR
jgi:hypothetical protein